MNRKNNKKEKIETPINFMESLKWNSENLKEAKETLAEWDKKDKSYYQNVSKMVMEVDLAEREHLRNSINFWEDRLKNES